MMEMRTHRQLPSVNETGKVSKELVEHGEAAGLPYFQYQQQQSEEKDKITSSPVDREKIKLLEGKNSRRDGGNPQDQQSSDRICPHHLSSRWHKVCFRILSFNQELVHVGTRPILQNTNSQLSQRLNRRGKLAVWYHLPEVADVGRTCVQYASIAHSPQCNHGDHGGRRRPQTLLVNLRCNTLHHRTRRNIKSQDRVANVQLQLAGWSCKDGKILKQAKMLGLF